MRLLYILVIGVILLVLLGNSYFNVLSSQKMIKLEKVQGKHIPCFNFSELFFGKFNEKYTQGGLEIHIMYFSLTKNESYIQNKIIDLANICGFERKTNNSFEKDYIELYTKIDLLQAQNNNYTLLYIDYYNSSPIHQINEKKRTTPIEVEIPKGEPQNLTNIFFPILQNSFGEILPINFKYVNNSMAIIYWTLDEIALKNSKEFIKSLKGLNITPSTNMTTFSEITTLININDTKIRFKYSLGDQEINVLVTPK